MIVNDDEYLFTLDNESIRKHVPFDLSDDECESIAYELESHFDDFVATWAKEWRVDHPRITNPCMVKAMLDRQVWTDYDYAMTVGNVDYECQDALDAFKLSELPPYADMFQRDGFLSYGDDLFYESVSLGLVAKWDGPFEVYVDEGDYDEYLRDRVLREYGRKLREEDYHD